MEKIKNFLLLLGMVGSGAMMIVLSDLVNDFGKVVLLTVFIFFSALWTLFSPIGKDFVRSLKDF